MRTLWNRHALLMNQAGGADGGGTGNAGGGTLLTPPAAGGGASGAAGNQATGNPPVQGGQATGNNPNAGGAQGGQANNWRSTLPAELQAEPSLQTFNDVSALAKSFIHAQKAIGADKLTIPGKHATEDDWKQVYTKLGLPADLKDYNVKMAESASIDKDFVEKFKATAHASGIMPQQAQKLADWFVELNGQSAAEVEKVRTAKVASDLAALKTEWGAAYDKNLGIAGQVLRESADPETIQYLNDTGLGNDIRLVKLLAKVGEKYISEEKLVGGNKELAGQLDPKTALTEANKIMGNFDHPYHKKDHPAHKAAVEEVQGLFQMAHPERQK